MKNLMYRLRGRQKIYCVIKSGLCMKLVLCGVLSVSMNYCNNALYIYRKKVSDIKHMCNIYVWNSSIIRM